MQRMLVHREQCEPGIVGLADRASRAMFINVADREILEIPACGGAPAPRCDFPGNRDHDPSGCLFARIGTDTSRLPTQVRSWQLFGGFFQSDCRPPNYPAAEGLRKPDRIRFAVEID